MIVEKKQVPDPEIIMKNYVLAYEQGLGSLEPEDKDDIIWFTCEVMPAVEKNWKPYNATKVKSYFHSVTASDEAFGLFLLKNYKDLPSFIKKPIRGEKEQENSTRKMKKEKLSGRKLLQAIQDYDLWLRQFKLLRKKTNPLQSHIHIDIDKHCNRILAETKSNPGRKRKHCYVNTNSLELAVDSLPF